MTISRPSFPLVSVVMPCYNAQAYVRQAVVSVFAQTYPRVQLIAVDDGSTDRTPEILHDYRDRIEVLQQLNQGPYPARNAGLRHASGELIAFLDADDYWSHDFLEKLQKALALHPEAVLAYCGWQNVGTGVTSAPYVPPEYEKGDPVEAFLEACPWPIHAALVRRSLMNRLGGFSERHFSSMDYDFWLRTLTFSCRFVRVPEVLAFYRWHGPSQISALKWRQVLDTLAVQKDFIGANPKLVAHLPAHRLRDLTEGQVLKQAYRALWKRDTLSAHKLFRHAAVARSFGLKELRHVLSALLPFGAYRWLVNIADRQDS